ncbi:sulfite exporter TauE/SafE family protein [Xanthomonas dyei]|uniref:Probable membrane transporter protein n=2 Tax=Xanthomonas dyei TaxID=743699 RepID=A0A2S7BX60_9XANT|nr:hypothetical protein XdyCFBP7245_21200 [Xanthomonas dyei]
MDGMDWIYPLLIMTGMLSGFLSGLLGVGGGFLMVPVFIVLLPLRFRIDIAVLPQVAVATALAATIPATASAVIAQYRRGALPIGWALRLAPAAGAGAAIGAIIAGRIHGVWVAAIFSAYAAYFGLRMIRGAGIQAPSPANPPIHTLATRVPVRLIGGLIGLFSATAGVGGASLTVPYVLAQHDRLEMRNAVAVGSAVGLAISLIGALTFVLGPLPAMGDSRGLVGLVCWTAAIAVALPATLLAPTGVSAAHRWPTRKLKRAFGLVMLSASLVTLWKVFC